MNSGNNARNNLARGTLARGGGDSSTSQGSDGAIGGSSSAKITGPQKNVFDQLGNEGLMAHVAAQAQQERSEESSLLALAGESEVRVEDLDRSDETKQRLLGPEGAAAIATAVREASDSLGATAMDSTALEMVSERVRQNLEVEDIAKARENGEIEDLVRETLRSNALESRDEVILALQQLMQNEGDLARVLSGNDPDGMAIELVEHLSVELVDVQDMYSLAAYDHGDMLKKLVLGDQALNVQRRLSPLAQRMGGFAAVMYQLLGDELGRHPLPSDPLADGSQDTAARLPAFRRNVLSLVTGLRLFRTSSAA